MPILRRVPDTELLLRPDGTPTPIVDEGDEVADLTQADAELLQVVYFGRALERLTVRGGGGGQDPFAGEDHGTQLLYRAVRVVPYGSEVVEVGVILNELVGHRPDRPDPLLEALNRLHEDLRRLADFALAAWVTAREENLAFLAAHSSAALHTAHSFVRAGGKRSDPVWAARIAIAERDSKIAVDTFARDIERAYWLRPYSLAAISQSGDPTSYYSGWMPHMTDRAEQDAFHRVWDYRWALPALVYAIAIRLLVLAAFAEGTRAERRLHCEEIAGYARLLGRVFNRRLGGIRTLERLSDQQRDWFGTTGRIPLAAVDIYAGPFIGGVFFESDLRNNRFAPGIAPPNLQALARDFDLDRVVRAFARHWWNVLYLRTGMEELLLYISALDAACDDRWFPAAFTNVHRSLDAVRDDAAARRKATLATSLSAVVDDEDADEDGEASARRTHHLFAALTTGGEDADRLVEAIVRDLEDLGSRPTAGGSAPSGGC